MAERTTTINAALAGTIDLGGDLTVNRFGFGAMRITGEGIWGEPQDREECKRVLRRPYQPDRYGRRLWSGGQRTADRRDPPPVSRRPGDRDQGRTDPSRPRTLEPRRPPGAPSRGVRGQPQAIARGPDRRLPIPPARSTGSL